MPFYICEHCAFETQDPAKRPCEYCKSELLLKRPYCGHCGEKLKISFGPIL